MRPTKEDTRRFHEILSSTSVEDGEVTLKVDDFFFLIGMAATTYALLYTDVFFKEDES